MKVVKNINNNVSLCLDSQNREVVAFGRGIGFTKPPYEIPLEKIQRTFYDIDHSYLTVIAEIPEEVIYTCTLIIDLANKKFNNIYSSNVIISLADHVYFAIKREKEHINLKLPLLYEVKQLYPEEMVAGYDALKIIEDNLKVKLPEEEAASIALHLVGYGNKNQSKRSNDEKSKIENVSDYIERELEIRIDKTGFNYSRFVTHMHYLLDRVKEDKNISSENKEMFEILKSNYPKTYKCSQHIKKILGVEFNDEELLYLIIHINRLCVREDCNQ